MKTIVQIYVPWVTNNIPDLCDTRQELKKMKKDHGVAWQNNNMRQKKLIRKMK